MYGLQRQVKYLQDQVDSSKPSPPSNETNSLSPQNHKPSSTNEMHSNAPHETKERVTVSTSKQTVAINKTNDLILNLTPENVTQHSRIVTTTYKGRLHY